MIRHDWTRDQARDIHDLPLPDLMARAMQAHRRHFDPDTIETASLLSIKTGGCPEDCGYCSQSAHHKNDAGGSGSGRGSARPGRWCAAILHGCGLAQPQGSRHGRAVPHD